MRNKLLIALITFTSILYGQRFPSSLSVPADTLCFSKPPEAKTVKELSLFGAEVVDTLYEPTAFILRKKIKKVHYYYLAVVRGEQFLVYTLFKGSEPTNSYYFHTEPVLGNGLNEMNTTRCQLNKKGNPELIIGFSTSVSSGAGPGGGQGYSRQNTGYLIWDLDNLECMTLFVSERFETWPYGGGLVATNSGMVNYTNFKVDFDYNAFNFEGEGIKKRKYIYTGTCFVKQN